MFFRLCDVACVHADSNRERSALIGSYALDGNLLVLIFKFQYAFDLHS